jgi:hypothetical protein
MDGLYANLQLTQEQTRLFCRGLLDLAAVDGLHENEIALIGEFFAGSGGDPQDLEALSREDFDISLVATVLDTETTEAFLMSCYMLIYADGEHSDEERSRIGQYAVGLGVSADRLAQIHDLARSFLLQNLAAGLRNRDVVVEVAGELGIEDNKIMNLIGKEG